MHTFITRYIYRRIYITQWAFKKVQGYVAPGFELQLLSKKICNGDELGASFCAYHHEANS